MEFVVVIVFDDGKAELLGKRHEPQAPIGLEQNRRRELMMRRDIDRAHALFAAGGFEIVDAHALGIEPDRHDLGTGGAWWVLGFAGSCALGSIYGFLQGTWPSFGLVEGVWSLVALRRWWRAESA